MFNNVRGIQVEFPTSPLSMRVARIQPPGVSPYDIVTPIPHEIMFKEGLAREAVVGRLKRLSNIEGEGGFSPEDLIPNPVFIDFLHRVVAKHAPELVEYQTQAKKQHDGWVYVIDGRTARSKEPILPQDILGAFAVLGGIIMPNSYRRNDQYVLFTQNGFFRLHKTITSKLMEELLALNANRKR